MVFTNKTLAEWAEYIVRNAKVSDQRSGQYLMNHLPAPAYRAVTGTLFDPFHKDLTLVETYTWLDNHLMFDGDRLISVFDGDRILWEEPSDV